MRTVLLVDSPRRMLEALKARLSLEPGLEIVGEAEDATLAISQAQALQPDVVLLDAEAADLDFPRVAHALSDGDSSPIIVVLTQRTVDVRHRLDGIPVTIVGKDEGFASLVKAIRSSGDLRRP